MQPTCNLEGFQANTEEFLKDTTPINCVKEIEHRAILDIIEMFPKFKQSVLLTWILH